MDESRKQRLIDKALKDQCSSEELKELYRVLTTAELNDMLDQGWVSLDPSIKLDDTSSKEIQRVLEKQIRRSPVPMYTLRIAASVALLAGVYFLFQLFNKTSGSAEVQMLVASTNAGVRNKVTLDDGSVVWLNAGSKLEYPDEFGNESRPVTLSGEGFFEVAKENKRPFIIKTGNVNTTVMGTSFNVRAYENELNIQITVATGKVKVASATKAGNEVILTPDRQTNYNLRTEQFEVRDIKATLFNDWRDGILHLDGSLAEIAPVLERAYGKTIIFGNKEMRSCRIAGDYKNESFDNVLTSFGYILGSEYSVSGDTVILKGKGCGK